MVLPQGISSRDRLFFKYENSVFPYYYIGSIGKGGSSVNLLF